MVITLVSLGCPKNLVDADIIVVGISLKHLIPAAAFPQRASFKTPLEKQFRSVGLGGGAKCKMLFHSLIIGVEIKAEKMYSDPLMESGKLTSEQRF